jgi:hypothetical protein
VHDQALYGKIGHSVDLVCAGVFGRSHGPMQGADKKGSVAFIRFSKSKLAEAKSRSVIKNSHLCGLGIAASPE